MNEIQTLLASRLLTAIFRTDRSLTWRASTRSRGLGEGTAGGLKKGCCGQIPQSRGFLYGDSGEEQEFLQKFALICLLSFDVYMKKMIVEQLVADLADTMKAQEPEKEAHKKKN